MVCFFIIIIIIIVIIAIIIIIVIFSDLPSMIRTPRNVHRVEKLVISSCTPVPATGMNRIIFCSLHAVSGR